MTAIVGWCSHPDCERPAHMEIRGRYYCWEHGKKEKGGEPPARVQEGMSDS